MLGAASLVLLPLSCCAAPLTSRYPSLVALCLSPLSPPLSIEITLHSARNAPQQGWLLCNKTVHRPLLGAASLVMLPLSCCAKPFTSRCPSLVALRLYPLSSPLSIEITLHSDRNASEQGWLLCYKTVHRPLLGAASLVILPLSCCAAPFTSRHPSLVALRLSPLSSPLSIEITLHSARNASEQGWLLCNKTAHHPLLGAASLVVLPLSFCAAPFTSRHPSLVALRLSLLLSPLSSLVASLLSRCLSRRPSSLPTLPGTRLVVA